MLRKKKTTSEIFTFSPEECAEGRRHFHNLIGKPDLNPKKSEQKIATTEESANKAEPTPNQETPISFKLLKDEQKKQMNEIATTQELMSLSELVYLAKSLATMFSQPNSRANTIDDAIENISALKPQKR